MLLASTLISALSFGTNAKTLLGSNPGAEIKIIFDQSHEQYFGVAEPMDTLISLLEEKGTVVINEGTITDALLADVSILVIPDPNSDFIANETEVIKNWIDNGGSLLIMGTWYRYMEPDQLNNITLDYGIEFVDSEIVDYDDYTDEVFHPIIYNWTNNAIANFTKRGVTNVTIGSNGALNVSGSAVPIATGDTDPWPNTTVAVDEYNWYYPDPIPPERILANGTDVIPFAGVDIPGGGRIFASGTTTVFADEDLGVLYINNPDFDNRQFALNVIDWLCKFELGEILSVTPKVLPLRENATVSATIQNLGTKTALNVNATITKPLVVKLHDTATIPIGDLGVGESYVAEWTVEGIGVGKGIIIVEVKSSNMMPVSKEEEISVVNDIDILSFEAVPNIVFTPVSNESTVNATIKNIASLETHDVTLTLVLPSGVTSAQSLIVNLGDLSPYNVTILTWDVTVEELGIHELTLEVSTTDGGNPTAKTFLLAIVEEMILYDNGHAPYVDADKAASFIALMKDYRAVYISNETITPELLSVTRLLVIPNPDTAHTTAEIQAIKDFVENGGALFIMGTYCDYFDPSWYDPITSDYNITWVDGSMQDQNDHDPYPYDPENFPEGYPYFVLLDTFPDNELANRLKLGVANIKLSGTSLNITDPANVNPIVTGDDDPFPNNTVTRDNGNVIHELNGTKTIPLAGVELTGGGKIVACGSDYMIRSDPYPTPPYGFFDHNEQFLTNLVEYLLEVPPAPKVDFTLDVPDKAYVDEEIVVSVVVENTGTANATGVGVDISLPSGLDLVNDSAIFTVGLLEIGQAASIVYVVKASEAGNYTVTVTVSGTNFEDVTKPSSTISVTEKPGIPLIIYVVIAAVVIVVIVAVAYLIIRRRPPV